MNHFDYRNGELCAEDVPLRTIAEKIGTPFYCYSTATLTRHYRVLAEALPANTLIAYSVKANGNIAVIRTLAKLGAGADVVSAGELKRAMSAGIPPNRIVFSGVGKTPDEMLVALNAGIHQFNVESEPELETLNAVAKHIGARADITIRVNPDVDAKTHAKITTGTAETKFGIPMPRVHAAYAHAARLSNLNIVGIDIHIGSQITELEPFDSAFARIVDLIQSLRAEGFDIRRADFGGGLGVPYGNAEPPPDPAAYGAVLNRLTQGLNLELIVEPGRLISANAGVLVTRVLYVKPGERKTFVVVDAGMNDLIRPAMYDAWHEIVPAAQPKRPRHRMVYDVVGPVCETADTFARDRELPQIGPDDLLVIMTAGAYGAAMSSAYNARPPAPEVLVTGGEWSVIKPRLSHEALIALERIPTWLA